MTIEDVNNHLQRLVLGEEKIKRGIFHVTRHVFLIFSNETQSYKQEIKLLLCPI